MNKPRLINPFVFPAETRVRFAILILLAITLAWGIGNFFTPHIATRISLPSVANCGEAGDFIADSKTENGILNIWSIRFDQTALNNRLTCFLPSLWVDAAFSLCIPVLPILLLLGLAGLRYRGYPNRLRKRSKLQPITEFHPTQRVTDLQNHLRNLTERISLSPPPVIELSPHYKNFDAQIFGRQNQYVLHLRGNLGRISLYSKKNQESFKAVLLHELAHIVNRDIRLTYMAAALWIVLVPLFTIQYGLSLFIISFSIVQLIELLILGIQIAVTLIVITLTIQGLIRIRELYADWRTALWGARDTLRNLFSRSRQPIVSYRKQWYEWWSKRPIYSVGKQLRYLYSAKDLFINYLSWHPSYKERKAALDNVSLLFHLPNDLFLQLGILLGAILAILLFILANTGILVWTGTEMVSLFVVTLVQEETPQLASWFWVYGELIWRIVTLGVGVLPILFVVSFFAGTIGFQIQRDTIIRIYDNKLNILDYRRLWLPASFLSIGIQAGFFITPFSELKPHTLPTLLALIFWFPLTISLIWLWLAITRFFAKLLLESHTGTASPKLKQFLHIVLSTYFLLPLSLPILGWQFTIVRGGIPGLVLPNLFYILLNTVVTFVGVGICFVSFVAFFIFIKIAKYINVPVCPTCHCQLPSTNLIGTVCENNHQLTEWLFVQEIESYDPKSL